MVNNNGIPIEVKKPFETVYELKNEVPSFEEFMKTYENDGNLNYDDLNGGSVGEFGGYGPMYRASSSDDYTTHFSIKYKFDHSGGNRKNYFEQSGNYSNV